MGPQPAQPDYGQLAAQQAATNRAAARDEMTMNMVDQDTPYGRLVYSQIGEVNGTPRFKATTELSASGQRRLGQQERMGERTGDIALQQIDRVGSTLAQPFRVDNDATEARLLELGRKRLDPAFEQRRAALDTDLVNRGIRPGTEAYARSIGSLNEARNDATNQLLLDGRQQAVAEAMMERQQPLRETAALMGYGALENPQFVSTPRASIAPVDVMSGPMEGYRQQVGQHNAMMGGLFSLGSAAIGGASRMARGGFG